MRRFLTRTLPTIMGVAALAIAPTLLTTSAHAADAAIGNQRVCAHATAGRAACDAHILTKGAKPFASVTRTSGYISAQLRTAYGLTTDSTATVAIVDAYHHPNPAGDLAAYRAGSGLPPLAAGQFVEYNQNGVQGSYATSDVGWGQEEMLDLEMVSAICPSCKIIYVGGNTASFADLGTAVNTAVAKGASVVSNSYGGPEFSGEATTQAQYYTHPGVAITVSSGDSGYGVEAPAAFNTVTAVGGTHLVLNANSTRQSETVWSGAGSGCSALIAKPTWQKDTGCARREVADVAAVADPNTGVAVYDSYGSTGGANWMVFGGTSVAAPIIGAVYALSGNTAGTPAQLAYTNKASLFDVTSGTNARHCRAGYQCTGVVGYDGPTGNGTPNGSLAPF
jgi:subtilase family serine protease